MAKFVRVECIVPYSAADYWKILSDEKFQEFQMKELGMKKFENLDIEHLGNITKRTTRTYPNVSLPAVVLKTLGKQDIFFEERQIRHNDTFSFDFVNIPPVFADRILSSGKLFLEPVEKDTCRQILEVNLQVKMALIGGMIEGIIQKELQRSYAAIGAMVQKWKDLQEKEKLEHKEAATGKGMPAPAGEELPQKEMGIGEIKMASTTTEPKGKEKELQGAAVPIPIGSNESN